MINKSILLATFLGVFILAGVQNLYSQTEYPPEMEKKLDQVIDLVRSEIKKERISFLGKFMSFSSDEATVFWPIYKEYEAEYDKLSDKRDCEIPVASIIVPEKYAISDAPYWIDSKPKTPPVLNNKYIPETPRIAPSKNPRNALSLRLY